MKGICSFFLLVFIAKYCDGRYSGRWVVTKDEALIDESLNKALRHISIGRDRNELLSKVSNVVCKKKLFNGVNIKLYFDLEQQRWKCLLYKPVVYTLGIQYESCTQITGENSSDEIQATEVQGGAHVESPVVSHDDVQENDDEAKIDELGQQISRKNDEDVRDEFKQQLTKHEDEIKSEHNHQQNSEQPISQDGKIISEPNNNENVNHDQINSDNNDAGAKTVDSQEHDDEEMVNENNDDEENKDEEQDDKEQDDEEQDGEEQDDEEQDDEEMLDKDSNNNDTNIQNDDQQKQSTNVDNTNNEIIVSDEKKIQQ